MGRFLVRLFNAIFLAVAVVIFVSYMNASAVKEVWIYSYFRFSMLALVAGVIAYFSFSFWRQRLLAWNAAAFITIATAMGTTELGLRMIPGAVPDDFLTLFPASAHKEIAASRGIFSSSILRGRDMLFSYVPGWKNPRQPWLKIDEDGYRNPKRPKRPVDVVLLGDSVMIAQSAKKDLGARFREVGIRAVNYGFGGYGLFHYRDVYRRMVLERGLAHRRVVVMITAQNDIVNSLHYLRVEKSGGDWQEFVDRPPSMGWPAWADGRFTPWSVSAVLKLPFLLRQRWITGQQEVSLTLPRGTLSASPGLFWFPDVAPGSSERRVVEDSLQDLIDDAAKAGAKVTLALAPNSALLYGHFAKGYESRMEIIEKNRRQFISLLKERFAARGTAVVDLTEPLKNWTGKELVVAQELDYHLNDRGVEIVFDALREITGR